MYLDYFGLCKPPFRITPDTHVFFEGCDRGAALHALCYAISHDEGITKVVGEVGSGKTMLCRMLPLKLNKGVDWVYLAHPSLAPEQILKAIALELDLFVPDRADKLYVMRLLHNTLLERHSQNRRVVVLIEEAQSMALATLEEVRLLSNLETDEHKLLQMVLFGQPELDDKLSNPKIRQLRERITQSFYLEPLRLSDIHAYLNFRLAAVGYEGPEIFTKSVAEIIARYSKGLIRRINIIADKSLLAAYTQDRFYIDESDIRAAVRDCQFNHSKNWWQRWRMAGSIAAIAMVMLGALGGALGLALNWQGVESPHATQSESPMKTTETIALSAHQEVSR